MVQMNVKISLPVTVNPKTEDDGTQASYLKRNLSSKKRRSKVAKMQYQTISPGSSCSCLQADYCSFTIGFVGSYSLSISLWRDLYSSISAPRTEAEGSLEPKDYDLEI
jgi:hypothetical protein